MRKIFIITLCILSVAFVSCSNAETVNESIKSAVSTLDSITTDDDIAITLTGKADQKDLLLFKEALLRLGERKIGSGFVSIDMADLYGFTTIDTAYFGKMIILKSVILPDVLPEVPKYMFSGCTELKEVTIPSETVYVGYAAFLNCLALETVNIESNILELGCGAFYNANEELKLNCQDCSIYYLSSQPFNIAHMETFYSYLPVSEALKVKKTLHTKEGSAKDFNLSIKYFSDSDCVYASVDDESGSCFRKMVTFTKKSGLTIVTGTDDIDGILSGATQNVVVTCPTDGSHWYYTYYPERFFSRSGGTEIKFDGKDVGVDASGIYLYKVPGGEI